ncbi:MAG: hypothetical protein OEM95_05050 [Gammaproteobacteria bacterium]|nr:hypothetical protein [Gammaproteobacteria bacterium]MDH3371671.1 hypothetical protein [Gammaproteobacteria bacterium]MDH5487619.1 hypothetical protein [Gammaproteobacteria bacterium]
MVKIRQIVVGGVAVVAAGLFAVTLAQAADVSGAKSKGIGPTVKIHRGEQCVEPTEDMRRNHMKYILHQRDKTMHQGIRTAKHSFKNCVDCHADPKTNSVQGQDGFCSSCHEYASVKIDCFSCHTDKRDKNAVAVAPFKGTAAKGAPP